MAERRLHSASGKAGGPQGIARSPFAFAGSTPFLWRPPYPSNDNPTPLAKRLSRALRLMVIFGLLGGFAWSAYFFR